MVTLTKKKKTFDGARMSFRGNGLGYNGGRRDSTGGIDGGGGGMWLCTVSCHW